MTKQKLNNKHVVVLLIVLLFGCTTSRVERALKAADAQRGAQKYSESELSYKAIIATFPGKPQLAPVYLHLGDLYFFNLKKNPDAITQYETVIEQWPLTSDAANAYVHLAEIYNQEDRFDRAIEMYENLIKYFPNHPDVAKFRHAIGAEYLKMKNYNQARLEFNRVLDAHEVPPEVAASTWYDMGETYFLESNESQALGYYKKLVTLYPKSDLVPMAKLQMAQCYEELNDLQNAVALEKSLRQDYPDNTTIKSKLQQMEKRRHDMSRGPQLLPWDFKALMKGRQ